MASKWSSDQIETGRAWLAKYSGWPRMTPEDFEKLSPAGVVSGVARHYPGGWSAFESARVMRALKCGEMYAEGNCEGCGMPQRECPSYDPAMAQLEFVNISGRVVHVARISATMVELREHVATYVWPFRNQIHAVRVNRQGREFLIRRPVQAYGPKRYPRPGVAR